MNEIDRLTSILTMSRRGRAGYTSDPVLDYTRPNSGLRILEAMPSESFSPTSYDNYQYGEFDIQG